MNFTSVDRGLNRDRFGTDADLLVLFIVGFVCRRSLLCCAEVAPANRVLRVFR